MKTDSDISDICFPVSFQFPTPRMETDRIRIETDSDISDIHLHISFHPYADEALQTYSFANLEHRLWVLASRLPTQTFKIFSSQTQQSY
jgi:hypothetical protein